MLSNPVFLFAIALAVGVVVGAALNAILTQTERRRLEREVERLDTELNLRMDMSEERENAMKLATAELSSKFGNLATESLKHNSEQFLKLAQQNLGTFQAQAKSELSERSKAVEALVKPIKEALTKTEAQIASMEKARSEAYGNIYAQLGTMQQSQKALKDETRNLVNALRRPEVRGQWGEMTLKRLVELAGMVEQCDFYEQEHVSGEDGAIRPDMIIRMPDDRELVVDVKTPLDAYLSAVEASTDKEREDALARHARKVSERIRELSSKAYWSQFPRSPEFVILFIPGDQFLSAALNERPQLIDDALRQKIILATPTSFVALLKSVAYGWRQLSLADNAEEIRKLGEDLYDRLAVFGEHMNRLGKQLGGSVKHFNQAVGSLERKVLPGARKFAELGVQAKKPLPDLDSVEALTREAPAAEPKIIAADPPDHDEP